MYPSGIELIVDEASPGHFYWLLQKRADAASRPLVVACAPGPMPSHGAAMMEGIAALQQCSGDPRHAARPATAGSRGGPCTQGRPAMNVWH